jgi:DNA-binding SARP family transcriptional activator
MMAVLALELPRGNRLIDLTTTGQSYERLPTSDPERTVKSRTLAPGLDPERFPDPGSPLFTLRLLGGASLSDDAGPVVGQAVQRRRVGLLALLSVAPRGSMTRDKVIGYLWPESTTAEARHLLSVALHAIRRTLGEDAVQAGGDELRLNSQSVQTDVASFERALDEGRLEEAVGMYAGPFLDGFYLNDAREFSEWTDGERVRLANRYASALESAADASERTGNHKQSVDFWHRRSVLDPYQARVALRLMRSLVAAGDRAGALQHARGYEARLQNEFGTKPEAEIARYVEELRDALETQSPELRVPPFIPGPTAELHAWPDAAAVPAHRSRRRSARVLVGLGVVTAIALGAYGSRGILSGGVADSDANRVLVFPLLDHSSATTSSAGEDVAIAIGAALEQTAPLQWLDGWSVLSAGERVDLRVLDEPRQKELASKSRARYYVTGTVVRRAADSVSVTLRVFDTRGDSVVQQASATGLIGGAGAIRAALGALNTLLPAMITPGLRDLAATSAAPPSANAAALANWLRGERHYRRAQYREAIDAFDMALAQDSGFALAALRAAKAARWLADDKASTYIEIALRDTLELSQKQRFFARGVKAYLAGEADSALAQFSRAIALDPRWSEAHAAAGEVYFGLFPSADALDSLAEFSFTEAVRANPEFLPARYLLTIAHLTRGDLVAASEQFLRYAELSSDSSHVRIIRDALSCARGPVNWRTEVAADLGAVLEAARILSIAGRHVGCAERAYRAVLDFPDATSGDQWAAVQGLYAVYRAQGRVDDTRKVIDEGIALGIAASNGLFIVAALEGAPFADRAAAVMKTLEGPLDSMPAARLWYFGAWYAQRKVIDSLGRVAGLLAARAERTKDRRDRLIARAIQGRFLLARGDTTGAVAVLASLRPNGPLMLVEDWPYEALGAERLMLARLLEARGELADAIRVSEAFDHPQPRWYLPLLPESLRIRARAARKLGLDARAEEYERRQRALIAGS